MGGNSNRSSGTTWTAACVVLAVVIATSGCRPSAPTYPVKSPGKWAVVLCKVKHYENGARVTDQSTVASFDTFRKFWGITTAAGGGVAQWFHDVSRGRASMAGSTVFDWAPIDKTASELTGLSRSQKAVVCAQASSPTRDYTKYAGIYAVFNEGMFRFDNSTPPKPVGDGGVGGNESKINGRPGSWHTVMDAAPPNLYFAAHEILHSLGFGHSFNENSTSCAPWGEGGEYCDNWDIMSGSTSVNALTMEQAGWIPDGAEVNALGGGRWSLAPIVAPMSHEAIQFFHPSATHLPLLDRPPRAGKSGSPTPIAIYIPIPRERDPHHHLTVEFHVDSGWEAGITGAVLIHEERIEAAPNGQKLPDGVGRSRLLNQGVLLPGASQSFAGYTTHASWCGKGVKVTVNSIAGNRADITVKYTSCSVIPIVRPTVVQTVPVTVPVTTTSTTTLPTTTTTTAPEETTTTTSTTTTTRPIIR